MRPHTINWITGTILVAMSAWAYFTSNDPSITSLIPGFFGLVFLLLTPAFRKENKVVAHIIVVLTLLLVIALIRPLLSVIDRSSTLGIFRVGLMLLSSIAALAIYIKSFVDARKARKVT